MKNIKQFAIIVSVFILLVSSVFEVLPSLAYLPPPLPKTIKCSPPMTANLSLNGITSLGEEGELVSAIHSIDGDVTAKLLYSDETYAELVPGENIQLAFTLLEQTMEARKYIIIIVEGHYYTITA